mmetsp:Transcript_3861/g.10981  ORF Transcript_3861/g.10981 Transcript_3861/m.10981 type:complete len:207 (+) Transcript_3861:73-693(+)
MAPPTIVALVWVIALGVSDAAEQVGNYIMEPGGSGPGNVVGSLKANATVEDCMEVCDAWANCSAFTHWPSSQRCTMKSRLGRQANSSTKNTYTKIRPAIHVQGYTLARNMDSGDGVTIEYIDGGSLAECARHCNNHSDCVQFTVEPNQCELKNESVGLSTKFDRDTYKKAGHMSCHDLKLLYKSANCCGSPSKATFLINPYYNETD